jgi:hypothetical protein
MQAAKEQLRQEGVSPEHLQAAAAALVGNAVQESKLNPSQVHDQGTGYGIYGARFIRRSKMFAWLSEHGYGKNSLVGQMRQMAHSAMTDIDYGPTRRALMGATRENLGSTASTVMRNFEAPRAALELANSSASPPPRPLS